MPLMRQWDLRNSDACLSTLLIIQCLMTFVLVPLVAVHLISPRATDAGLLCFVIVCAVVYVERARTLLALLGSVLAVLSGPYLWSHQSVHDASSRVTLHETILAAALLFNMLITALVTQHTFSAGPVTRHRILGAILVYLNVAVVCSILYDFLDTMLGGSMRFSSGALLSLDMGARQADFTYFSLVTITTCGYGDIVPVHPFVRSLANVEALFGQLFPATFVARLVALHLSRDGGAGPEH
ncbi:MAG: potassium channel family protein [Telluria sp.]